MITVGTILIPKKDKEHLFPPNVQYVITQRDVDDKGEIGEYWTIKLKQSK